MIRALLACCVVVSLAASKPPALAGLIDVRIDMLVRSGHLVDDFRVSGRSHEHLIPRYLDYARSRGVPVYRVPIGADTGYRLIGLTSCPHTVSGRVCIVLLDSGEEPNGQLHTLLHELGHLEHGTKPKTVGEAEVWAETIAYLVLQAIGMEASRESLSYIAAHLTAERRGALLTKREQDIRESAERLAAVGLR